VLDSPPGRLSLRRLNPLDDPVWDDLIRLHPGVSFFHTSAWARVLRETYNFTPIYLLASSEIRNQKSEIRNSAELGTRNTELETNSALRIPHSAFEGAEVPSELGTRNSKLETHSALRTPPSAFALPLMEIHSPFTGRRGVSLPFTDTCAPLISDSVPLPMLLHELTQLAQARRWNYWECRGLNELPAEVPPSLSFYGHTLDLSPGEERLFAHCKSTVRTAIRKAEQAGVQVEASTSLEALQTFYSLHCKTRRKHGLPPQPFRFFRSIHRHILRRRLGQVIIARFHQKPIAADVFFHSAAHSEQTDLLAHNSSAPIRLPNQAIYKYGASDDAFQELRASNLVMWHAIRWYARHGYESLHFGRTSLAAEGLRRFKLGWGADEEQIHYLRHDLRRRSFVRVPDNSFRCPNAILARMPLPILRLLGAILYRHMT